MRYLSIILSLLFTESLYAIQPATLQCANIASNGDVTISWQGTTEVSDFVSYQLFFSNNIAGPYNLLTTVNNATILNFSHVGAGADVNNVHYFLITNGTASIAYSDTLSTIQLTVSNNNDGNAQLTWNPPISPIQNANNWYRIYKESPIGVWSLTDSTQGTTYNENYDACDIEVSYKIEIDGIGCTNQSAVDVIRIRDLTPPSMPILDSVSIHVASGDVSLGWEGVADADTKGYIVYLQQGGVWMPLDTIFGRENTFYRYTDVNSSKVALNYRIASIDSCFNTSPLTPDQHSMVLNYSPNNCLRSVTLSWNKYDHLPSEVLKYEIYQSENGGAYQKIGETLTETTFSGTDLIDLNTYQFYIRAVGNNGFKASSSVVAFEFHQTKTPRSLYFRYATVNEAQTVDLAVYVDTSAAISGIVLYKKYPQTPFLQMIPLPYQPNGHYYYTDPDVNTSVETYQYTARVIDICGNHILHSDTVHNILLSASNIGKYFNRLTWLPYSAFLATTDNYTIYRSVEDSPILDPIGSVSNATTSFQEDVTPLRYQGAFFNYWVEAQEAYGNPFEFKDISRSNRVRVGQSALTFIPNAFAPNGENKIFKPSNIFVSPSDYHFVIYARNGSLIFETNDPNEGWDGYYRGSLSPLGTYSYHLHYKNTDGTKVEREGFVILVR